MRPAGGIEEDALGAGREEGSAAPRVRGRRRASGRRRRARPAGGATFQAGRPSRGDGDRLVAAELDRVGVDGGDDRVRACSAVASAVMATMRGRRPSGAAARTTPRQVGRLVERQRARRAGDEVQPDRIGTGRGSRRATPAASVDPADLHERPPRDVRPGRRARGRPPRRREPAAAGSAARMSASPTSAPSNPSARQRATVAASRTPDSAMTRRSSGTSSRRRSARSGSTSSVRRSRLLMPMSRASVASAARSSRSIVRLDQRLQAEVERPRRRACASRRRRMEHGQEQDQVGAGRAQRSAAGERRPRTPWPGPGSLTAARTARRSSIEPPNQCGSHSTEIAAAPPASYARARATMSSPDAGDPTRRRRRALDLGDEVQARRGEAFDDGPRRSGAPRARARARSGAAVERRGQVGRDGGRRSRRRRCVPRVARRRRATVTRALPPGAGRVGSDRLLGRGPLGAQPTEQLGRQPGIDGQGRPVDAVLQRVDGARREEAPPPALRSTTSRRDAGFAAQDRLDVSGRSSARRRRPASRWPSPAGRGPPRRRTGCSTPVVGRRRRARRCHRAAARRRPRRGPRASAPSRADARPRRSARPPARRRRRAAAGVCRPGW